MMIVQGSWTGVLVPHDVWALRQRPHFVCMQSCPDVSCSHSLFCNCISDAVSQTILTSFGIPVSASTSSEPKDMAAVCRLVLEAGVHFAGSAVAMHASIHGSMVAFNP